MIQVYESPRGAWRWRVVTDTGEVVATGADVFPTREHAMTAVERMQAYVKHAHIEHVDLRTL